MSRLAKLRQEGVLGSLETLLRWKLWMPLARRRWRSRCRAWQARAPRDFSESAWQLETGGIALDWYAPAFPLSRGQQDEVAAGLQREDPAAVVACLAACERFEAGDYSLLLAGGEALGRRPDWLGLIDGPGRWPDGPTTQIDYLSEGRPGDIRRCWELNRCQHWMILGRGWRLSGDPRWPRLFAQQLGDWLEANPWGRGPNWAQAQEVALRGIAWGWAWHLFHDAPGFDEPLRRRMLQALGWHLRTVEEEVCAFGKWTHNHLISELTGLLLLARWFPFFARARRLEAWSGRLLAREARKQVWPDGMDGELATAYHFFKLDSLAAVAATGAGGPHLARRVAAMGETAAWLLRPDGSLPAVGDCDDGRGWRLMEDGGTREAYGQLPALLELAALPPWTPRPPAAAWRWLFGARCAALATAPRQAPATVRIHPEAGVWIWREHAGEDASWLLFRGGATRRRRLVQQSHHHADVLSFEFAWRGRPLFVDPGSYAYGLETARRQALRASRAHSTLSVDGHPGCDFRGLRFGVWNLPLSSWTELPTETRPAAALAVTYGAVHHERHLRVGPQGFVIEDWVRRPPMIGALIGFQLAPGLTVIQREDAWELPEPGLRLRVRQGGRTLGRLAVVKGAVAPRYGLWQPAPRLELQLPASSECRIHFHLEPLDSGRP
jgi:hypothetical protein